MSQSNIIPAQGWAHYWADQRRLRTRRRRLQRGTGVLLILLMGTGVALFLHRPRWAPEQLELLTGKGPVEVLGGIKGLPPIPGTRWVAPSNPSQPKRTLLVGTHPRTRQPLEFQVPERRASLPEPLSEALAQTARRILAGEPIPQIRSFPTPLREIQEVEVMVLLRDGEVARLWRSARASSVARGLMTAANVARQRWTERSSSMGGSLSVQLPRLQVEVSLLEEQGTIHPPSPALVRLTPQDMGIGFERKGVWRYRLPEAMAPDSRTPDSGTPDSRTPDSGTEQEDPPGNVQRRDPWQTLVELLEEDGLDERALSRPDIRVYRLRKRALAVSPPTRRALNHAFTPEPAAGLLNTPPKPTRPKSLPDLLGFGQAKQDFDAWIAD